MIVYATGYKNKTVPQLAEMAERYNADVVDVRFQPFSRTPFGSNQLREALGDRYVWLKAWGNALYNKGGYQIHDYLEYQFSREYLNGERERKRQVAATRRAAARSSTNQESSAASSGACSNVPSRPVPSGSGSSMGGSKLISLRSDQRARRLPAQPTPEEIEEISANAIGEEPEEEAGS